MIKENDEAIVIKNVTKKYKLNTGSLLALDCFNASIKKNEFICLLGPSGCGKSTLLWALGGLHNVTSGEIIINGSKVTKPRDDIGFVFQDNNLLPWCTIIKNVLMPFEIKKLNKEKYSAHIKNLFKVTELGGFEDKHPAELSGGMQQRAAIIRALSYDPSILLLDEPFGALDEITKEEMHGLLLDLWSKTDKTIVFVTHNITEAVYLADRIFMMTPRPGCLQQEFKITLSRPRKPSIKTEKAFLDIVDEIRNNIGRSGDFVHNE